MSKIEVFYEATPNPQSMKFNITSMITDENVSFDDPVKAQRSPLAQKIFGFPWASSVMIGPNFVTVTKQEWVEWSILADPLCDLIQEHINSDEPVLLAGEASNTSDPGSINDDDSDVVKKIKTILNEEVRPAVAMDGGDIVFNKFEEGMLYLEMHGACSGCPSSTMTLKEGVERRLKEDIPELIEVQPVY